MSADYSYLKLSLRYVHGAKSTTVFSYPSSEKALRPSFDAPQIMSRFVNLHEFYVMGCHDTGRYFSLVSVDNVNDSGARLELTLTVEPDVLLPGRSILNLFSTVKDMTEKEEAFTDATLAAALNACGFPEEPLRTTMDSGANMLSDCSCYRTYVSSNDLGIILSFPRQETYKRYSETVLTHVTAVPSPEIPLPQITNPVRQAYAVVCPPDVTPSVEGVVLTDRLSLTYSRPGFEPTTISFEVGTTNRFVKIASPALIVNDAAKASIVFVQKVDYTVMSSKGEPVSTYTILINGRTATRADGRFEVTSNDFNKEGIVNITVSSTNYFNTSIDFTSEELAAQRPLELILVPEELPLMVRLDFGGGRILEQELMLEKSSNEYRQLRAGNFHGYRAHRLMSHEPETYVVDMAVAPVAQPRPAAPKSDPVKAPVAVVEEPAAVVTPEVTEEKPKAEEVAEVPARAKSAAELRAERLRKDIPTKLDEEKPEEKKGKGKKSSKKREKAYEKDIPRKPDILDDDPDDDEVDGKPSVLKQVFSPVVLAIVAVVCVVVGIVWYLYTLLPANQVEQDANAPVDVTAQVTPADDNGRIVVTDDVNAGVVNPQKPDSTAEQKAVVAADSKTVADEKADLEYLNSKEVWKLSDLKSEKYRNFFTLLGGGDINAIANADYYAVKGLATNKKAVKVVEFLWEAKGTYAEKRNVEQMKGLNGKESINIHELYETLATMRDAKPNKEARPQREQ